MKVLLLSPNTLTVPYPVYPLGLDYVAGALDGEHEVTIVDMNVTTLDALAGQLAAAPPDIIGLSCRNIDNTEAGAPLFFIDSYRELVRWLRARSSALLVCGGSGFTIMPEELFAALRVDYGIIGEGERFAQLVNAVARGEDPSVLPGVLSAGTPCATPSPWPGTPRRFPPGAASHLHFYLERGGMLNLQSKRGCSFNCIYCPYPRIEGSRHRLVPAEEVARHALTLQEAGARYLFITDSAFNSDIEHSLAVARAFKTAGLAIPWGAFFAPRPLPADYFSIMAAAGLRHVEFGTESLSATMLRTYRKPFSPPQVIAAHNQARQSGLHTAHYFLLGGPGESAASVAQTLDAIEELERAAFFFFIGIRIYPGTALHEIAVREGRVASSTDLLRPVYYQSKEISRQAIEEMVLEKARGRFNWIVGSGGAKIAATVAKMHQRGHVGPLWEFLAR